MKELLPTGNGSQVSEAKNPIQQLAGHLNEGQVNELIQALNYLTEIGSNGGRQPAEGSVGAVLNGLSPEVRDVFMTLTEAMGTKRNLPFQPKMEPEDYARTMDMDPTIAGGIHSALTIEDVAGGLQERMGTDADEIDDPNRVPSLRELIGAAMAKSAQQGVA